MVGDHPAKQAQLFYLAFGPPCPDGNSHVYEPDSVCDGCCKVMKELHNHADWDRFAEYSPEDFHDGKEMFYSLAQAICSCMSAVNHWAENMLAKVLDELFINSQRLWKRENVAGFLLFCSEKVSRHNVFVSMCIVVPVAKKTLVSFR